MKDWYKFIPLPIIYIVVVFVFADDSMRADEARYLMYVENLLNGFFTDPNNPELLNTPLYPLFIYIFSFFDLPILIPKLFNAVFCFGAILFFYYALLNYVNKRKATLFTWLLALYYPFYFTIFLLMAESITLFFICGFIYFFSCYMTRRHHLLRYFIGSSVFLGLLLLSKFLFAYVIITCIILLILHAFIFSFDHTHRKITLVLASSFIWAIPYLFYTYSLTGRAFYWATSSGEGLYFMTTTHPQENGSWLNMHEIVKGNRVYPNQTHKAFFDSIYHLPHTELNDIMVDRSVQNIKTNPSIYISNLIPNILRFFFGYPYSYTYQNLGIYKYFINIPLLASLFLSFIPVVLHWRKISLAQTSMLFLALIYIGGSLVVSSVPRYFIPAVPFLMLWIAYIWSNFIDIKISFQDKNPIKN